MPNRSIAERNSAGVNSWAAVAMPMFDELTSTSAQVCCPLARTSLRRRPLMNVTPPGAGSNTRSISSGCASVSAAHTNALNVEPGS